MFNVVLYPYTINIHRYFLESNLQTARIKVSELIPVPYPTGCPIFIFSVWDLGIRDLHPKTDPVTNFQPKPSILNFPLFENNRPLLRRRSDVIHHTEGVEDGSIVLDNNSIVPIVLSYCFLLSCQNVLFGAKPGL